MIQNDYIIKAVFNLYSERKAEAENKAYELNEQLKKDKNYTDNHFKIKSLSFDISKAEYEENAELSQKLKSEREILREKEVEILREKGLTENDLKPQYNCQKCGDTAYTKDGRLCPCFFDTLKEVTKDILNIPEPDLPSFEDYKIFDKNGEKIKNILLSYVEKFPPEKIKNLIFTGGPGTGKTFSAGCIASALRDNNKSVIYLTSTKLNDVFFHFHTATIGDKRAIGELITQCDLLVIDDLGTEPIFKNVTIEYLVSFISERLNYKKPFIITTNLTMEEIKERYTERLFSRLCGEESARIEFSGKDLRIKI